MQTRNGYERWVYLPCVEQQCGYMRNSYLKQVEKLRLVCCYINNYINCNKIITHNLNKLHCTLCKNILRDKNALFAFATIIAEKTISLNKNKNQ